MIDIRNFGAYRRTSAAVRVALLHAITAQENVRVN